MEHNFGMFAKLDEAGNIVRPPHNDGNVMNSHLNFEWLTSHGFEEHTQEWFDEHTPTPIVPDETAFLAACQQFKAVCTQIGSVLGKPDFRGGFDEMAEFQQSAAFSSLAGVQLAMCWSAANELCKYEGAKLGYGQPDWWYKCWKMEI